MELENKAKELGDLLNAFQLMNSEVDLNEVLNNILNQMLTVVKAEAGTLWLLNEEAQYIEAIAVEGPITKTVLDIKMKINEGIVGEVIETGITDLIEDVSKNGLVSARGR